jgi:hypothetical protein
LGFLIVLLKCLQLALGILISPETHFLHRFLQHPKHEPCYIRWPRSVALLHYIFHLLRELMSRHFELLFQMYCLNLSNLQALIILIDNAQPNQFFDLTSTLVIIVPSWIENSFLASLTCLHMTQYDHVFFTRNY